MDLMPMYFTFRLAINCVGWMKVLPGTWSPSAMSWVATLQRRRRKSNWDLANSAVSIPCITLNASGCCQARDPIASTFRKFRMPAGHRHAHNE